MLIATIVNYDGRNRLISIVSRGKDVFSYNMGDTASWMMQFTREYLKSINYIGESKVCVLFVPENGSTAYRRDYTVTTHYRELRCRDKRFAMDITDVVCNGRKYINIPSDIASILSRDIKMLKDEPNLGDDYSVELFQDTEYYTEINLSEYCNIRRYPTIVLVPKID